MKKKVGLTDTLAEHLALPLYGFPGVNTAFVLRRPRGDTIEWPVDVNGTGSPLHSSQPPSSTTRKS